MATKHRLQFCEELSEQRWELEQPRPSWDERGRQISRDLQSIARMAARVCGTPIAFVTLCETRETWLSVKPGVAFTEDRASCFYNVLARDVSYWADLLDSPFCNNIAVTNNGIRSHAAASIADGTGHILGALCVLDLKPHQLDALQLEMLLDLADMVASLVRAPSTAPYTVSKQEPDSARPPPKTRPQTPQNDPSESCSRWSHYARPSRRHTHNDFKRLEKLQEAARGSEIARMVFKAVDVAEEACALLDPSGDRLLYANSTYLALVARLAPDTRTPCCLSTLGCFGIGPSTETQLCRAVFERKRTVVEVTGRIYGAPLSWFELIVQPIKADDAACTVAGWFVVCKLVLPTPPLEQELPTGCVSVICHEMRTPLNAVTAYGDLLLETKMTTEQRQMLQIILSSADSLLGIIDQVVNLSKLQGGSMVLDPRPFDLYEMLDACIDTVAPFKPTGVELAYRVDPQTPHALYGDDGCIKQIVLNLLSNALKFCSSGDVFLEVSSHALVGTSLTSCNLLFSVKDTGIGVPEELQRAIFEPFMQIDNSSTRRQDGMGMGLALSEAMVKTMGGAISCRSFAGIGSVFEFDVNVSVVDSTSVMDLGGAAAVRLLNPRHLRAAIQTNQGHGRDALHGLLQHLGLILVTESPDLVFVSDAGWYPTGGGVWQPIGSDAVPNEPCDMELSGSPFGAAVELAAARAPVNRPEPAVYNVRSSSNSPVGMVLAGQTPPPQRSPQPPQASSVPVSVMPDGRRDSVPTVPFVIQLTDSGCAGVPFVKMEEDPDELVVAMPLTLRKVRAVLVQCMQLRAAATLAQQAATLALAQQAASLAQHVPLQVSPKRSLRVLVADDISVNRKVVEKIFARLGVEPAIVCNGMEAVAAYARCPFDVIFMDLHMPVMDGFEAARCIMQMAKTAAAQDGSQSVRLPRICAITADVVPAARERCIASGMCGFISKPFKKDRFEEFLQSVLNDDTPSPQGLRIPV